MPRPKRPEWQRAPQSYPAVKGHPSAKLGVYQREAVMGEPWQEVVTMHLIWEQRPVGVALCGATGPWVNGATGHEKLICTDCAAESAKEWDGA